MSRLLSACLLLVSCLPAFGQGQRKESNSAQEVQVVGLRLRAIPELVYVHLPNLPRGQGLAVEQVANGSLGSIAGLKKNDLVLQFNGVAVQDADHFKRLVETAPPLEKRPLVLVREGKEQVLDVLLNLPPSVDFEAKGNLKPGGPPAVSVEAEPLGDGKHRVTFLYYANGNSKLERATFSGSMTDIERQMRVNQRDNPMPQQVQDLAEAALKRLRQIVK